MRRIRQCRTKCEREALEREYGTRYSVLSHLTHFSSVRMAIIDPMHNLFLGTAKHILNIWKSEDLLDEQKFSMIEENFEKIEAASDVGKLPTKVLSAYNKFTADELKNWVLLFSLFALKDVLQGSYLQGWRDFVLACRLLCSRVITEEDITLADLLLLRFCRSFERLYGNERVTPNMHLHGHLKECLIDYGPVYSFWLFSFERYNGILGSLPTNKRTIEKQLMRRFLRGIFCHSVSLPVMFHDKLAGDVSSLLDRKDRGSLVEMAYATLYPIMRLSSRRINYAEGIWNDLSYMMYKKKPKVNTLSEYELHNLIKMYQVLYPNSELQAYVSFHSMDYVYIHR